tara:strand:+ start:2116 stop:2661 length:546 start_codon:yes stop_codon:yes gene_type:complete
MAKNIKKVETRGRPSVSEATRLTGKQFKFVELVATREGQDTLQNLAVEAGFSVKGANTRAYELLNPKICPHVVKALRERREQLAVKYEVNYARHIKDLQKIRDEALVNGAYSAAVQAEKARGLAQGNIYVNKSEVRHGSIDSMSKEEVQKALVELKKQLGEKVIEVEPERVEVLENAQVAH